MIESTGEHGATPANLPLNGTHHSAIHTPITDGKKSTELNGSDLLGRKHIQAVVMRLAAARQMAVDCGRSLWDFAVELTRLLELGIDHDELRWMIGKGYCEHAYEKKSGSDSKRSFESQGGFSINQRSCFVLSERGLSVAKVIEAMIETEQKRGADEPEVRPTWDVERHELRLGSTIVKQFKWRASNQEKILEAFEEEDWPPRIDDPLPQDPNIDPKRRLNDAIKSLNRKQKTPIVRFHGDGSGQGIFWELTGDSYSVIESSFTTDRSTK